MSANASQPQDIPDKAHPKEVVNNVQKLVDDHGKVVDARDAPGQQQSSVNGVKSSINGANSTVRNAKDKIGSEANRIGSTDITSASSRQEAHQKAERQRSQNSVSGANDVNSKQSNASSPAPSGELQPSDNVSKKRLDRKEKLHKLKEAKPAVPDFVGWKQVGGWDDRDTLDDEEEVQDILSKSTLLENYISDKFYGDWYHNTALLGGTAFFSWLLGRYAFGISWLVIILLFTGTIYRTSSRRLRVRCRDDITREMGLKKLETDHETMEWMNSFLEKFWLIYEPALAEMVITIGNENLKAACPSFLESLSLDTFTLGTKPFRVDHVRTFPRTDPDVAVMDWKFSFTPNDTEDMTARQLKSKVNPKIALGVRVGKGVISKSFPVLVEDMTFAGLMRVRVKMITTFPHIQTVDVSFLEPPLIDYVLKPVGGETLGIDINIVPGLSKFIKEMVDSNLGPMLYAPNAFQVNVEQMLSGTGMAIGVLTLTIKHTDGLKGSDRLGNTVDPYIKFMIGEKGDVIERTSTKNDTSEPIWNETKHILLTSLTEILYMDIVDFNDIRPDKLIGRVDLPLERLRETPSKDNNRGAILRGGKNRGSLIYDVSYNQVLESRTLEDGTVVPPPDSNSGILYFNLGQARDLDARKSLVGSLSTYAEIALNDNIIGTTKTVKNSNSPQWGFTKEFIVGDKSHSVLSITVKDSRSSTSPVVGKTQIPLRSLLSNVEKGNDELQLAPGGKLKVHAAWKPVPIPGIQSSAYIEPIGVYRLGIKRARGLKNLEFVGKIDPYIQINLGHRLVGKTAWVEKTVDPDYDEVFYIPVDDVAEELTLSAYDWEKVSKDQLLGSSTIDPSKFLKSDAHGSYASYRGETEKEAELSIQGKIPKGKVYYTLDFYPCQSILTPEEVEEKKKKADEEAAEKEKDKAKNGKDEKKKKTDEDDTDDEDETEEAAEKSHRIEMPLSQQLEQKSGIVAFIVHGIRGNPKDVFLRAKADDKFDPIYVSERLRKSSTKSGESFNFFARELKYSEIVFEVVSKALSNDEDDTLYAATFSTRDLFQKTYEKPAQISLPSRGGSQGSVQVTLQARFSPVDFPVDFADSVLNQGFLRVDVMDAHELEKADRFGKSDPYVKFFYLDKLVYKTKEMKKTLDPVWNEFFEVEVTSRLKPFIAQVYDFDVSPGPDDELGNVTIDLKSLEPNEGVVMVLDLEGHSGHLRLRLNFEPKYVRRNVKDSKNPFGVITGNIGAPGKMIMDVGGAPVKVVGNVAGGVAGGVAGIAGGVGGGLSKGVKGIFGKRGGHSQHAAANTSIDSPDNSFNADNSSLMSGSHNRTLSDSSQTSAMPGSGGALTVTLGELEGLDASLGNVQLKVSLSDKKEKDVFKSKSLKAGRDLSLDEQIRLRTSGNGKLIFRLRQVHALGRHSDIAEDSVNLQDAKEIVSLGPGKLHIKIGSSQ